jgi:hypothetical protein
LYRYAEDIIGQMISTSFYDDKYEVGPCRLNQVEP